MDVASGVVLDFGVFLDSRGLDRRGFADGDTFPQKMNERKNDAETSRVQRCAAQTGADADGELRRQRKKRGNRRDPLWETMLSECGVDATTLTASGRGASEHALHELHTVGANADEIRRRAAEYRRTFNVPLTPAALAKHWAALGRPDDGEMRSYAHA
jgi:hypothetical protein